MSEISSLKMDAQMESSGTTSVESMTGSSASLPNPRCLEALRRSNLEAYLEQAHSIVHLICTHLDYRLNIPKGTLSGLQPLDKPSGTNLRLLPLLAATS